MDSCMVFEKEEKEKGRCRMRKLLTSLLVLAMCAPAMAATITFGPANNSVSGQVAIPWTADAGVVGMALKVDVTGGGTCTAVAVDSFFDVFMDYAYTQELPGNPGYTYKSGIPTALQTGPGELALPSASFSISIGGLDDDGIGAGTEEAPLSGTIVLTGTPGAPVAIAEDTLRGGVVGYAGAMTIVSLPISTSFGIVEENITKPSVALTTPVNGAWVNSGRSESFTASGAVSSLGHTLEYQFTWGDGVVGPWGAAAQSHTYAYTATGTYAVTVQARCATHTDILSAVSDVYTVSRECLAWTATGYADWRNTTWNRPTCWCFKKQCNGDSDGILNGPYRVGSADLTRFLACVNKADATVLAYSNGICADYDHTRNGPYRVGSPDLTKLLTYVNKSDAYVPQCAAATVNFWTN
jgi:hypothetical protein